MIIGLRTDSPVTELFLYGDNNTLVGYHSWEAHRTLARDLLAELEKFMRIHGTEWNEVKGILVYQGPGSFTGLRIGITVANAIAYAKHIPIIGVSGEGWQEIGLAQLARGQSQQQILPVYGAEPRITSPSK